MARLLLSLLLLISFLQCNAGESGVKKFPWAGGLNAAQFLQIDLDLDGTKDLVIFDRHGKRLLTFINKSTTPGDVNFEWNQSFASHFPDFHDWVIMTDYDLDGREDIFTYGLGGARVFRNVSADSLKFELVTNLLTSWYYTGEVGILITNVDYPVIEDLDGDGDKDLLTFFGLGSFVEYHRNMSMENYGNCAHLEYRLEDKCWGDFKEGIESNEVILNVTCPYKYDPLPVSCNDGSRHTGSTLFSKDFTGDGLPDLILGDVDFPKLITLVNGGTIQEAHMVSQDTIFPFESFPIDLYSFPAVSSPDLNNDGKYDLVVSIFDPSLINAENKNSCKTYINTGTINNPVFTFSSENFFQDQMTDLGSGAYPVLADVDGDGLTDLLTGNFGYYDSSWYNNGILKSSFISRIAYFRNTGTATTPLFNLIDDDLGGLSSLKVTGLYPACGDIDADGDADLIIGRDDGSVLFLKNTGIAGNIPVYEEPVTRYMDIDPGDYSAPQIFDLDKDGLPDIVAGEKNGNINFYKNSGTSAEPVFTLVNDSLGKINVTNYNLSYDGFSTPFFFRKDDGTTALLCGCEEGLIHYYVGIDDNLTGKFTESSSLENIISDKPVLYKTGIRTAAAISHITSSGYFDMIEGNYCGGMNYFSKNPAPGILTATSNYSSAEGDLFDVYPNPANEIISIRSASKGAFTASFFSVTGNEFLHQTFRENLSINTRNFAEGFYLLRITPSSAGSSGKVVIFKVVINH